ncbi:TPA: hypothetical protein R5S02_004117 [Salmonella enterica]|nr:hypothetical protein [Salmonella enterica]
MVVLKWIFIERWKFKKIVAGIEIDIGKFLADSYGTNIYGCRDYPGIFKDMLRILLASNK